MENTDNICKLVLLIVCVGELRGEVRWNKSVLKKEIPTERFLSWCVWDHQFSCNFIHVILGTPSSPLQSPSQKKSSTVALVKANWKGGRRLTREMWWEIGDVFNISSLGVEQSLWVTVHSGFASASIEQCAMQCVSGWGAVIVQLECISPVSVCLTQLIPALLSSI